MARQRNQLDERRAALLAKRRAGAITRAERAELNDLEDRIRKLVEWVTEPCDEHGDIIDPDFHDTQAEAGLAAHRILASPAGFPGLAWVDVARLVRTGSESAGELARGYSYRTRYYLDGRVVELAWEETPRPATGL